MEERFAAVSGEVHELRGQLSFALDRLASENIELGQLEPNLATLDLRSMTLTQVEREFVRLYSNIVRQELKMIEMRNELGHWRGEVSRLKARWCREWFGAWSRVNNLVYFELFKVSSGPVVESSTPSGLADAWIPVLRKAHADRITKERLAHERSLRYMEAKFIRCARGTWNWWNCIWRLAGQIWIL